MIGSLVRALPGCSEQFPGPLWHCPLHKKRLTTQRGELICTYGHSYPIVGGIARFARSKYSASFGVQWKVYVKTQLDSYTHTTISRDRARRCLGEQLWESLEGKHVLECGCGAGRFTEVLLQQGALVTSIDLSDAIEANAENFPESTHHRIAQADISELPFADRQFDVVFCLGVLQHTPSPEEAIRALYRQVKPGGSIAFDHYSSVIGWYLGIAPLFRELVRRLPPERGMKLTSRLVDWLLPLHQRGKRFARLLSRISPVMSYYDKHPALPPELQVEWAKLDTYDALGDWYKRFRSRRQLLATAEDLGIVDVYCRYGGNGVEFRGSRARPLSTTCGRSQSPTVSVVTRSLNYAHYLLECIESTLKQPIDDLEVIVVDDGSTDETATVARSFADRRVRLLQHERTEGPGAALNAGIRASRGTYVALLDGDDVMTPRNLRAKIDALNQYPEAGLVYSNADIIDASGFVIGRSDRGVGEGEVRVAGMFHRLLLGNAIVASSVMVRRECFNDVGPFDEALPQAEDWDMWLRLAAKHPFVYLGDRLIRRRSHSESLQSRNLVTDQDLSANKRVLEKAFERFSLLDRGYSYDMLRARHVFRVLAAKYAVRPVGEVVRLYWREVRAEPRYLRSVHNVEFLGQTVAYGMVRRSSIAWLRGRRTRDAFAPS